jgi:hypothetical protein
MQPVKCDLAVVSTMILARFADRVAAPAAALGQLDRPGEAEVGHSMGARRTNAPARH